MKHILFILLISSNMFVFSALHKIASHLAVNEKGGEISYDLFYFHLLQSFYLKDNEQRGFKPSSQKSPAWNHANIAYFMEYLQKDNNKDSIQICALPYKDPDKDLVEDENNPDSITYYAHAAYIPEENHIYLFDYAIVRLATSEERNMPRQLHCIVDHSKINLHTSFLEEMRRRPLSTDEKNKIIKDNTSYHVPFNGYIFILNNLRCSCSYQRLENYLRNKRQERNQGTNFLSSQTCDNAPAIKNSTLPNMAFAARG